MNRSTVLTPLLPWGQFRVAATHTKKKEISFYPAGSSASKTSDLLEAVFHVRFLVTYTPWHNCRLRAIRVNSPENVNTPFGNRSLGFCSHLKRPSITGELRSAITHRGVASGGNTRSHDHQGHSLCKTDCDCTTFWSPDPSDTKRFTSGTCRSRRMLNMTARRSSFYPKRKTSSFFFPPPPFSTANRCLLNRYLPKWIRQS